MVLVPSCELLELSKLLGFVWWRRIAEEVCCEAISLRAGPVLFSRRGVPGGQNRAGSKGINQVGKRLISRASGSRAKARRVTGFAWRERCRPATKAGNQSRGVVRLAERGPQRREAGSRREGGSSAESGNRTELENMAVTRKVRVQGCVGRSAAWWGRVARLCALFATRCPR